MPDPKAHDQPAEGGTEAVEHTLQKQSEPRQNRKPTGQAGTDNPGTSSQATSEHRSDRR